MDEDESGLLAYKWDDAAFERGDFIEAKHVYTTIDSLFKNDPSANWFARPEFGK